MPHQAAASRHSRVLIITRNLPPLVGGMERLNWHMADELSRHAEVRVIGPRGTVGSVSIGDATSGGEIGGPVAWINGNQGLAILGQTSSAAQLSGCQVERDWSISV